MKVELSNTDKVLFGDSGITKGQLIDYYRKAAELLIRHAGKRSLSFVRCPDGIDDCFFQKDKPEHYPDAIESVAVDSESRTLHQVVIRKQSDLVYLANQGCIEIHAPLATIEDRHKPDKVVFDLDPPGDGDFTAVKKAARIVRDCLDDLGLRSPVTATGSKGLHVVVPIRPEHDFDTVRKWARGLTGQLAEVHDGLTTEVRRNKRKGRLFLDIARNAYGQTAVAPYSVRAIAGAPVATPLDWDELDRVDSARKYHIGNIFRRLGNRDDPWQGFGRMRQSLELN